MSTAFSASRRAALPPRSRVNGAGTRLTNAICAAPPVPALPEADASDMDYFLAQLQIVLPVLGGRERDPDSTAPIRPASAAASTESPVFRLAHAKPGVDAQAQQIDGEFTVLAGSLVPTCHRVGKADCTVKAYASYRAQHERLVSDGAIVVESFRGRLIRDIVSSSPSTAGAMALGRSCNGRREWISPEGSFGTGRAVASSSHA